MGDYKYAPCTITAEAPQEVNVLVTGFDIFLDHNANASWLVAKSLATELIPKRPGAAKINVHVRQTPLRVAYSYVRQQVPPLLFPAGTNVSTSDDKEGIAAIVERNVEALKTQTPNFDVVLLIGMAAGNRFYCMETLAHRDGYTRPDVEGKKITDDTYWKDLGMPEILHTGLETGNVWRRWKDECMDLDVRPPDDAGRYLCDFVFYTALAEYWKRKVRAPVAFLHVPGETTEDDLKRGKRVAEGLLRAMTDSEREQGARTGAVGTEG